MDAGDVLVDRYRLLDRLGVGGMSVVWRAHDEVLRRDVAVKVLAAGHRVLPPDAIRAEAQATARLAHAHVANVFDYGEIQDDTGDPVPFIVMELLHGTTLAVLAADGPLRPEVALRACAEVAEALAEAHAHGLVHRDVKPSNVIMTAGGAKVFDFGIAVPVGTLDHPGPDVPILGTPAYVAPERITGGEASPASDVYSLGVLLYRLLTHQYPWPAGTASHLIIAHVYGTARDLPAIDGVPASVQALYRACVAKAPADRPTAADAAAVLAAAVLPAASSGDLRLAARASSATVDGRASRWLTSRPWLAVAAFAAAGALAVALISLTGRDVSPLDDVPAQAAPPAVGSTTTTAPAGTPATPGTSPSALAPGPNPPGGPAPTAAPPPPAPTTAPVTRPPPTRTSTARTFTSAGGTIVADCNGTRAVLVSWQPATGFRVHRVSAGPAERATVSFRQQSTEIRMTATCPDGTATVTIE